MPLVRIKSLIMKQVLEQMTTGTDEFVDLMFPLSQSFRDILGNAFFKMWTSVWSFDNLKPGSFVLLKF